MTIAEVVKRYELSADTLRYYERVGLIPAVRRTGSGLRDYSESDVRWVEFIKCMRAAGVSIETLTEYLALFQQGQDTIQARKALLVEQRKQIAERIADLQATLSRLDKKLDGYEERMMTYDNSLLRLPD